MTPDSVTQQTFLTFQHSMLLKNAHNPNPEKNLCIQLMHTTININNIISLMIMIHTATVGIN